MCPDCGRPKMLFETERKANDFIKWNGDELHVPDGCELRAYYCPSCCGWHISHQRYKKGYDKSTDRLIYAYHRTKRSMGKIDRLIHYVDIEREAERIFEAVPEEHKETKGGLRKYLNEYFASSGMDKGGAIRSAIYKRWNSYIYKKYNG